MVTTRLLSPPQYRIGHIKTYPLAEGGEKMVTLDKETGEVTLKLTLPGFSKDSPR